MLPKEKIAEGLVRIGFTDKEAKIYLTVLELKEALPSSIARRSGVKRSSAYLLLGRLSQKGLLMPVKKNGHLFFRAKNPDRFLREEIERFANVQVALESLNENLPELLYLHHTPEEGVEVFVFKGKDGLLQIERNIENARRKSYSYNHSGNEITIYGDKVAIISRKKEMGVIIQNSNIAEAHKMVLEALSAKKKF